MRLGLVTRFRARGSVFRGLGASGLVTTDACCTHGAGMESCDSISLPGSPSCAKSTRLAASAGSRRVQETDLGLQAGMVSDIANQ